MKNLYIVLVTALVGFGVMVMFAPSADAVDIIGKSCDAANSELCKADSQNIEDDGVIKTLVDVLMFFLGVVSVISIIIGGLIYITSNGDASKVTQGKNILLYSVVGLIVALMSWGIVRFILERF